MKVEIITTPSEKDARLITLRHVPETPDDEKIIKKMAKLFIGMGAIVTFPEIKGKKNASMMFTRSEKRAGTKS